VLKRSASTEAEAG